MAIVAQKEINSFTEAIQILDFSYSFLQCQTLKKRVMRDLLDEEKCSLTAFHCWSVFFFRERWRFMTHQVASF
jgi:hypothetical protein